MPQDLQVALERCDFDGAMYVGVVPDAQRLGNWLLLNNLDEDRIKTMLSDYLDVENHRGFLPENAVWKGILGAEKARVFSRIAAGEWACISEARSEPIEEAPDGPALASLGCGASLGC
jgi:hypothetical protein